MYLGYMHRGLSIVGLFALIVMAASFFSYFGLGVLVVLLPIVWMYSSSTRSALRRRRRRRRPQNPMRSCSTRATCWA